MFLRVPSCSIEIGGQFKSLIFRRVGLLKDKGMDKRERRETRG